MPTKFVVCVCLLQSSICMQLQLMYALIVPFFTFGHQHHDILMQHFRFIDFLFQVFDAFLLNVCQKKREKNRLDRFKITCSHRTSRLAWYKFHPLVNFPVIIQSLTKPRDRLRSSPNAFVVFTLSWDISLTSFFKSRTIVLDFSLSFTSLLHRTPIQGHTARQSKVREEEYGFSLD